MHAPTVAGGPWPCPTPSRGVRLIHIMFGTGIEVDIDCALETAVWPSKRSTTKNAMISKS
jgi:hypothetical protein